MSDLADIYYDPFDFEIDKNPYPVWARMRDEAPLWYNERHDFFAVSRYADVEQCMIDWDTYRSGNGSTLEIIKANIQMPPGIILMEDPPQHDMHRGVLSRVFTPRKMNALEDKIRAFSAQTLDPMIGAERFDFITDLGAFMPMRTIGMLLGIPEQDQVAIRDRLDEGLKLDEDGAPPKVSDFTDAAGMFAEYIDWREKNPSDDLMTEMLNAEFVDETGTTRTLDRGEIMIFLMLLAGAGNETTTRLIGWAGKLLSEHADQRRMLAADRTLIPKAIEEILRYEAPSPVQARTVSRDVEVHGTVVPKGSVMVVLNGAANRDSRRFPNADEFNVRRDDGPHLSFGYGIHFCLGAALARVEGRVALEEVLKRFPDWEVDWSEAVQAHTPTVRGWEKLPAFIR